MKNNYNIPETVDLNKLLSELKTEDSRYARMFKMFQTIYLVLILIHLLLTILVYLETRNINEIIGGACFITSFVIFALFFEKYHKEYKYVNYAAPTIKMLRNAVDRYKPFQLKALWLLLALGLMEIGFSLNSALKEAFYSLQLFFPLAIIAGLIIGYIIWFVKYKPLHDNALRLIFEIEDEIK